MSTSVILSTRLKTVGKWGNVTPIRSQAATLKYKNSCIPLFAMTTLAMTTLAIHPTPSAIFSTTQRLAAGFWGRYLNSIQPSKEGS
ncbi:hypothetical protein E4U39_000627 [Claviceps sp. Clav50 group G5]|nr:hypothetical protein E4U39_000627 [Claviceps sp. Clav50 group G5]